MPKFIESQASEYVNSDLLELLYVDRYEVALQKDVPTSERRWWAVGRFRGGQTAELGPRRTTEAAAKADLDRIVAELNKPTTSFIAKLL